jgi:hypothetical protein
MGTTSMLMLIRRTVTGEDVANLRFELRVECKRIWSWLCSTCSNPESEKKRSFPDDKMSTSSQSRRPEVVVTTDMKDPCSRQRTRSSTFIVCESLLPIRYHGEYYLKVPLRVLVESTSSVSPTHYPR